MRREGIGGDEREDTLERRKFRLKISWREQQERKKRRSKSVIL